MSSSSTTAPTSSNNKPGALIFLHGLGDTPAGWSSLEFQLPQLKPRLANLHYVFPHAPTLPISINGGMQMPSWFDLFDWPIEVGCTDDRPNKLKGVDAVHAEIDKLVAQGVDRSKIVIGGFSQGGAIGLLAAYHPHGRNPGVGGCVALSGWLTLVDELNVPEEAKATPLFWGHGLYDDKVLFDQQTFGTQKLEELGVQEIDRRQYPMGHSSDPDEIVALAEFLDRIIFGASDDGKKKSDEL